MASPFRLSSLSAVRLHRFYTRAPLTTGAVRGRRRDAKTLPRTLFIVEEAVTVIFRLDVAGKAIRGYATFRGHVFAQLPVPDDAPRGYLLRDYRFPIGFRPTIQRDASFRLSTDNYPSITIFNDQSSTITRQPMDTDFTRRLPVFHRQVPSYSTIFQTSIRDLFVSKDLFLAASYRSSMDKRVAIWEFFKNDWQFINFRGSVPSYWLMSAIDGE